MEENKTDLKHSIYHRLVNFKKVSKDVASYIDSVFESEDPDFSTIPAEQMEKIDTMYDEIIALKREIIEYSAKRSEIQSIQH